MNSVAEVFSQVDDVEGEPADDEDQEDRHQDAAPSSVPLSLQPPPVINHTVHISQYQDDLMVLLPAPALITPVLRDSLLMIMM